MSSFSVINLLFCLFFLALSVSVDSYSQNIIQQQQDVEGGDIWNLCKNPDPSTYILRPEQVSISPGIPTVGQDITVTIKATSSAEITSGQANVAIKLGFLRLSHDFDLCGVLNSLSNVKCPISEGSHEFKISARIPDSIPALPITGTITVKDHQGKLITCFNINFKLNKS